MTGMLTKPSWLKWPPSWCPPSWWPWKPKQQPEPKQEPSLLPELKSKPEPVSSPGAEPQPYGTSGPMSELGLEQQSQPETQMPNFESIAFDRYEEKLNCFNFVSHQRKKHNEDVPSGFTDKEGGFYTGIFKGQEGELVNGTEYGQEPRVGAIMVESPSSTNDIPIGHVSFVYEVERGFSGRVVKYKIAEGAWAGEFHEETFTWNEERGECVSSSIKRSPDVFINGKLKIKFTYYEAC